MIFYFCVFLSTLASNLCGLLDLEVMQQSFVLETKKIQISGHPDAFNPSIVNWQGRYLMSFRSRNADGLAMLVGFIWLDENFNPAGEPQLLEIEEEDAETSYIQDPRLFVVNDKLYMSYSDLIANRQTLVKKRSMCFCEIKQEGSRFLASHLQYLQDFEGDENNKFEKNWVPFSYQNILLLAYTISPHKIFLPIFGERRCVTIAESFSLCSWNWGVLRGGTPALPLGNSYLAFFHSSTSLATVQSQAKPMMHYFMGAYLFENQPPFVIKKISCQPIVHKDFYKGQNYKTWKPLQAIFPCGFVYDDKYIWVSYGRQDHEAWIVKLDKKGLFQSLISVESHF